MERLSTFSVIKHEKIFIYIIVCSLFFFSCRTTAGILDNNAAATETREHIGELQSQQAEIAEKSATVNAELERVTDDNRQAAEKLNNTSNEIIRLDEIIRDGTEQDAEFAKVLREIYKQPARAKSNPP